MSVAKASVTSSMAKWSPMHERGPPPNSRYCHRSRALKLSGLNRSGSNRSGSSQCSGRAVPPFSRQRAWCLSAPGSRPPQRRGTPYVSPWAPGGTGEAIPVSPAPHSPAAEGHRTSAADSAGLPLPQRRGPGNRGGVQRPQRIRQRRRRGVVASEHEHDQLVANLLIRQPFSGLWILSGDEGSDQRCD